MEREETSGRVEDARNRAEVGPQVISLSLAESQHQQRAVLLHAEAGGQGDPRGFSRERRAACSNTYSLRLKN